MLSACWELSDCVFLLCNREWVYALYVVNNDQLVGKAMRGMDPCDHPVAEALIKLFTAHDKR